MPPQPTGRRVIRVHESPGEQRAALLQNSLLTEFFIDRPGAPDGLGDIHTARVTARVPAMAGSFLALHDAEAFLPDSESGNSLSEGDWVIVRVMRGAQGGKGPRVSMAGAGMADPAEGPARLLRRGPSALEELQDAYSDAPVERRTFDDTLEAEIDALTAPDAILAGGVRALFNATPALTAIDLDGAATTASRTAKDSVQMAANLAALPDLGRQIVLRNFSGAILVDFAGLPSRKRKSLGPALEAVLARDRLMPRLAGFSHLGFAEIERRRLRPPLHEKLASAHGIGLAALRQVAAEVRAAPARQLALRAGPAVVAALEDDAAALAALAREAAYPLVLRRDATLARAWFVEDVHG
jgi:ribonuclease G